MKKFFTLLVMAVFAANLSAQEEMEEIDVIDSSYRIYMGVKGGANFSTMNGLPDVFGLDPKMGIGFQGGVVAGIRLGRWGGNEKAEGGTGRFGIQLEALYSQRTVKTEIENLKLSYFEVPVLAQCYVTHDIFVELGPTVAGTLSSSPDEIKTGNMIVATGELKGFDVMLTGGVGYKHKSGFIASARYNYGMSELAGNFPGKVSTFNVSVGWVFDLNN